MIAERLSQAAIHALYTLSPRETLTEICGDKQTVPSLAVVYSAWDTIPYLSLKENLFLGLTRSKRDPRRLNDYLKLLDLNEEILQHPLSELTAFEKIRLQTLQQLLRQPETLVFDDVTLQLTIKENQELLYLAILLKRQLELEILFVTSDASFAKAVSQMNN